MSHRGLPELTRSQQQAVLQGAAEIVAAATCGEPQTYTDPTLAGCGDSKVAGAFVSLKRGNHLRSCCGVFGAPLKLSSAVKRSAIRSAIEDPRFPPTSPRELLFLRTEVWLLSEPEAVELRGVKRITAVEVGKHGLVVSHGGKQGLLLPSVAVEHGWNAETFLRHTCAKAGLPADAWTWCDTQLQRFEGAVVEGDLAELLGDRPLALASPDFSAGELTLCQERMRAALSLPLQGEPLPDWAPLSEIHAHGMAVKVQAGGEWNVFHRFRWRESRPLSKLCGEVMMQAGSFLRQRKAALEDLQTMILFDPALQGSIAAAEFGGLEEMTPAVAVVSRDKVAWAAGGNRQPQMLLESALKAAALTDSGLGMVLSYRTIASPAMEVAIAGPAE